MSSSSISSGNIGDLNIPGLPKNCSCGRGVSLRISKSEGNPNRRYYRCDLAYERKLVNDNHLFKWLDIALVEEARLMSQRIDDLRKDIGDLFMLQKDTDEKIEEALMEAKKESKKLRMMMLSVVVVTVGFIFLSKHSLMF